MWTHAALTGQAIAGLGLAVGRLAQFSIHCVLCTKRAGQKFETHLITAGRTHTNAAGLRKNMPMSRRWLNAWNHHVVADACSDVFMQNKCCYLSGHCSSSRDSME